MEMNIKGHVFGTGSPVVCIPVVEVQEEKIVAEVKLLTEKKTQMIEWRMDWYEQVGDLEAVKNILKRISDYVADTVLLCTFRSKAQGGQSVIGQEEYISLNRTVAHSGVADIIDLEFYEVTNPKEEISRLKESGVKVVCSNHDFEKTPSTDGMRKQLEEMVVAGADFAKLAVMPKEKTDVLRLMEAVIRTKEVYSQNHFIAMSMGKEGAISRLLGEWYHSEVTFAVSGKASAPGQISNSVVEKMLELLGESIK